MSRKIITALLASALAAGCGSKPEPTQPVAVATPEPKVELTPQPVKASHEMDVAKHVIPPGPVAGRLGGVDVTAEVRVEGPSIVFEKPEAAPGDPWRVSVELPTEPGREGSPTKLVLKPDEIPMGNVWSVFVQWPKPLLRKWEVFSFSGAVQDATPMLWRGNCAITLEFGKRENGKVPGKVFLSLPDVPDAPTGSFLAGTFVADSPRLATDPPGPEDVPYVKGTVAVRGAAPNANLKVGYVGSLGEDRFCLSTTFVDLDARQYARSNYDKPHVSTLVAGDGKDVPSKYEHSKLTPGRYLVFAGLATGPVNWKWIDVKSGDALTADLTIDAAQVGSLDVAVPLEAVGKVQMAPADDAGQPAAAEPLFQGRALVLGLEADIVNRKAKFTNLAPGKYEVRAAKQSRTVEIFAGKTAELDFDKK